MKQKEGGEELDNETPRVRKERKGLWYIWGRWGGGGGRWDIHVNVNMKT